MWQSRVFFDWNPRSILDSKALCRQLWVFLHHPSILPVYKIVTHKKNLAHTRALTSLKHIQVWEHLCAHIQVWEHIWALIELGSTYKRSFMRSFAPGPYMRLILDTSYSAVRVRADLNIVDEHPIMETRVFCVSSAVMLWMPLLSPNLIYKLNWFSNIIIISPKTLILYRTKVSFVICYAQTGKIMLTALAAGQISLLKRQHYVL